MRQFLLCSLIYIGLLGFTFGQGITYPGGVSEPYLWIKVKSGQGMGVGDVRGHARLENLSLAKENKLNSHPIFKRQEDTSIKASLKPSQAEQISLFIVYEGSSKEEQVLWSLWGNNSPKLVATTHRLADLETKKYRSYPKAKDRFKIHYYQHRKVFEEGVGEILWDLGGSIDQLPPSSLLEGVAEIILYDRVLSPLEMQQVASYLAIKYGISLSQLEYKNYYNSKGEVIWDYKSHKEFNQNITAIGKDKEGGVLQISSENANDEKLISMSLLPEGERLADNQFTFWSDNGGSLQIKKQEEGWPKGIERKWYLDKNQDHSLNLMWYFDPQKMIKANPKEEKGGEVLYHWLVIDTTSKFNPKTTKYIKLNKVGENDPVTFSRWHEIKTKQLIYTIWVAPAMFGHLEIEEAKCTKPNSGKVQVNIVGGEAPYQVSLISEDKSIFYKWEETNNIGGHEVFLSSGRYKYQIKDSQNRIYQQEFYLLDQDMPTAKIAKDYILKEPIVIDLKEDFPKKEYTYEWYYNDQIVSRSHQILLNKAGSYQVRIRNAKGCQSVSKFNVLDSFGLSKYDVVLYPNPSSNGYYQLLASFPEKTNGSLNVYDISGQMLYTEAFYNVSQYNYKGYIGRTGTYLIQIKTTFGSTTHKLNVK